MSLHNDRPLCPPPPVNPPPCLNPQHSAEIQTITSRLEQLRRAIAESEKNLNAQKESMPLQTEHEFRKQVVAAEEEKIRGDLTTAKMDIGSFSKVFFKLNKPKAKYAILSSRNWILNHCTTDQQREIILSYLFNKVKDIQSNGSFRRNILYLVNDWAHYCKKHRMGKVSQMSQMLSRYVPQMYAFTAEEASTDAALQPQLEKLRRVWEGSKYFNDQCLEQLRNPHQVYVSGKSATSAEYATRASNLEMQLQAKFAGYEQQHLDFVRYTAQQVSQIEAQLQQIRSGMMQEIEGRIEDDQSHDISTSVTQEPENFEQWCFKAVLDRIDKDHNQSLPAGWIAVKHKSGMPLFIAAQHKELKNMPTHKNPTIQNIQPMGVTLKGNKAIIAKLREEMIAATDPVITRRFGAKRPFPTVNPFHKKG